MFSGRLGWPQEENRLSVLLREKRRSGAPLLDLTESNPTRVGLAYPADRLGAALADPAGCAYEPDPRGLPQARAAVAAWCNRHGQAATAERMVLTTGSSEAYALLFKMLMDPGEAVLVPRPGYPLFDYLAGLESVRVTTYSIDLDDRWHLDLAGIERALQGGTGMPPPRAVVLVNPGNPTGIGLRAGERRELERVCGSRGIAIISDEVFFDYRFDAGSADLCRQGEDAGPGPGPLVSMAGRRLPGDQPGALSFTLGGLSKACGLPQMKLGWILVEGPESLRREALERLELIADTYLSVGTPVQRAAPELLSIGDLVGALIQDRVCRNREALGAALPPGSPCRLLPADGGWYAVLQVPAVGTEEELVLQLLQEDNVLVHPGYFFDFPREAFLTLSLLPEPSILNQAVPRILARVAR